MKSLYLKSILNKINNINEKLSKLPKCFEIIHENLDIDIDQIKYFSYLKLNDDIFAHLNKIKLIINMQDRKIIWEALYEDKQSNIYLSLNSFIFTFFIKESIMDPLLFKSNNYYIFKLMNQDLIKSAILESLEKIRLNKFEILEINCNLTKKYLSLI